MYRVRLLSLLLSLSVMTTTLAETESVRTHASIHAEIDRTVWRPFKEAFETLNGQALNQVYGNEVLRVTPAGIDTRNRFKLSNLSRFDGNRKRGDTIKLDFWFDSRQTNETNSYEVGFFRIGITSVSGDIETHYGQFHIVLKNQGDKWKIIQDWDTTTIAGEPIDEQIFQRKSVARF